MLIRFEAPPNLISSLERYFRLSEHIIKFLIIKVSDFKKKTDLASISADNSKDTKMDVENNYSGSTNGEKAGLKNSDEL